MAMMVMGMTMSMRLSARLALVFSGPLQVVTGGQSDVAVYVVDSLFNGRAKVAPADGVFDGDEALAAFTVDLFRAVVGGDFGQLRQ